MEELENYIIVPSKKLSLVLTVKATLLDLYLNMMLLLFWKMQRKTAHANMNSYEYDTLTWDGVISLFMLLEMVVSYGSMLHEITWPAETLFFLQWIMADWYVQYSTPALGQVSSAHNQNQAGQVESNHFPLRTMSHKLCTSKKSHTAIYLQ